MPRLVERIQAAATTTTTATAATGSSSSSTTSTTNSYPINQTNNIDHNIVTSQLLMPQGNISSNFGNTQITPSYTPENSSNTAVSPASELTDCYAPTQNHNFIQQNNPVCNEFTDTLISPSGYFNPWIDYQAMVEQNNQWSDGGNGGGDGFSDDIWNAEDIWFLKQFNM